MDCTICGKPTLLGAMLCAPCKAALKRARYVTVQEDIRRPSVIDVRRQVRRRAAVAAADAAADPMPESLPPVAMPTDAAANAQLARRIFGGVFVLAALLGSASYFGLRDLGARPQDESTANSTSVDAAATVPVTAPPTAAALPAAPPAMLHGPNATETPLAEEGVERKLAVSPSAATNNGKRSSRNATSFATASGDPPDAVAMPEPERPQPLPAPPPPPAPDRWQNMRDAIALCDREGVFGGIICGQKARIQYCDGYWGKVAVCPGPTANPEH